MKFVMHRNHVVASLSGHVIRFTKGEPTHVPSEAHKEVIAAGGVPEGEIEYDEGKKPDAPEGKEREDLIRMAMEDMVVSNVREEFTAGGFPHTKKLSEKVGFTVNNKERDSIWNALKQAD